MNKKDTKNTMINIKADIRVKQEAQLIIDEMGLTLSGVINAFLKQLIRTREITFYAGDTMTPYMKKVIAEARKDINRYKFRAMPFDDVFTEDMIKDE
ncbi:MAG: type II toxin-antitoxin system RelB/DinJ family antitoxin [Candidatus Pacebacteria bacterium]|nr:type II toxin-antitoxin system RelB/DinJ family antitoxin [Candidatus Paceibacterota bacterium]MBP9818908.1 type II toxin-antitoxin system RelB/DinJ family antitoxin [Candidatus Paceibacterota bacterium]